MDQLQCTFVTVYNCDQNVVYTCFHSVHLWSSRPNSMDSIENVQLRQKCSFQWILWWYNSSLLGQATCTSKSFFWFPELISSLHCKLCILGPYATSPKQCIRHVGSSSSRWTRGFINVDHIRSQRGLRRPAKSHPGKSHRRTDSHCLHCRHCFGTRDEYARSARFVRTCMACKGC